MQLEEKLLLLVMPEQSSMLLELVLKQMCKLYTLWLALPTVILFLSCLLSPILILFKTLLSSLCALAIPLTLALAMETEEFAPAALANALIQDVETEFKTPIAHALALLHGLKTLLDHALFAIPMLQPSFDVTEEEQLPTQILALDAIAITLGPELTVEHAA